MVPMGPHWQLVVVVGSGGGGGVVVDVALGVHTWPGLRHIRFLGISSRRDYPTKTANGSPHLLLRLVQSHITFWSKPVINPCAFAGVSFAATCRGPLNGFIRRKVELRIGGVTWI